MGVLLAPRLSPCRKRVLVFLAEEVRGGADVSKRKTSFSRHLWLRSLLKQQECCFCLVQESVLKEELRRLDRNEKRGSVDMTYLKNVVLKLLETGKANHSIIPSTQGCPM